MPSLIWREELGSRRVLTTTGTYAATEGDIAAASGSSVFLFVPSGGGYRRYAVYDAKEDIAGIATFRPGFLPDGIAVITAGRLIVLGNRKGALIPIWQAGPEEGADFSDVAAGDLNGDGRDEIVITAPGTGSIYVYGLTGEEPARLLLELIGIRTVSGTPHFVRVFKGSTGNSYIAAVYEENGKFGLTTYSLSPEGFVPGPVLELQPLYVTAMTSGDFGPGPGQELALGGTGGMVWLVGDGSKPKVLLVTKALGNSVSALSPLNRENSGLAAGTPEGNAYIFNYPVRVNPDVSFSPVEGVTGLAGLPGERVAVGTATGGLQVWYTGNGGDKWSYVVKPGDTLWNLSRKFGVPLEQIMAVNNNISNPDLIMPGQIINIPRG
ncbi:MAG: LysM peptidoglycan-binding domain-containing protein [Bacillota bacterium]